MRERADVLRGVPHGFVFSLGLTELEDDSVERKTVEGLNSSRNSSQTMTYCHGNGTSRIVALGLLCRGLETTQTTTDHDEPCIPVLQNAMKPLIFTTVSSNQNQSSRNQKYSYRMYLQRST